MKVEDAISKFIDYVTTERRLSDQTVLSYSTTLKEFHDFLKDHGISDIEDVRAADIREWQIFLMESGHEPSTVNRCIVTLRSWYKYLRRQKIVLEDVMAKVTSPKLSKHLPIFFREKEVEHIYEDELYPEGFEGERDKLMLRMLYETGMRRAELVNLKDASVDLVAGTVKVLGKRDKERFIPIENDLVRNIYHYLSLKGQIEGCSDAFFVKANGQPMTASGVYAIVRKYMTLLSNANRISPHVFRHSFATHMLNEGADINAIKELLGHSSLSATEVYTHVTREHLKETYKHAHPRANKK